MIDHFQLTGKQSKIISIVILIILNIVIYWNIQNHAFVNYDDPLYITLNDRIQAEITLKSRIEHIYRYSYWELASPHHDVALAGLAVVWRVGRRTSLDQFNHSHFQYHFTFCAFQ